MVAPLFFTSLLIWSISRAWNGIGKLEIFSYCVGLIGLILSSF